MIQSESAVTTPGREVRITRRFDAPRELVWDAWTQPQHVVHWWGPAGFTTTIQEMDVRPGGVWRFVMHGSDRDFKNRILFREVVRPERLAYAHGGEDDTADIQFEVTVDFVDEQGKTRLDMSMAFPTVEERDRVVREFGALEGVRSTMDRLAEHLTRMPRAESR